MPDTASLLMRKLQPFVLDKLDKERGALPSFPLQLFVDKLQNALGLSALAIHTGCIEWKTTNNVITGLGISPVIYQIDILPLAGKAFWLVAERDIKKIVSWLLASEEKSSPESFIDEELTKGVYEYLLLEAVEAMTSLPKFQEFAYRFAETPLPEDRTVYAIDISIEHDKETLWTRFALTKELLFSVEKHFYQQKTSLLAIAKYTDILLPMSLSAGDIELSASEWERLEEGDFVLLDYPCYRPATQKGILQLCIEGEKLFQVKIKENTLKILDFIYAKGDEIMSEDANSDAEEPLTEEPLEKNEMRDDQEDLLEEEERAEESIAPREASSTQWEKMSVDNVPLQLHVEIQKLQLSLGELQKLRPGHTLPLSITTQSPTVHMTLNGRAVAEGELLELSDDVVGIRIHKVYK